MFNKKEYMKEYNKKYYIDNTEKYLEKNKKFKENNPNYFKEHNKEYTTRLDVKNRIKEYQQQPQVKEQQKESRKKYIETHRWVKTLSDIIQRCTNPNNSDYKTYKGRRGDITKEELKELWFRDNASGMEHPTIDRIDPNGIYTKSNLQYLERLEHNIKTAQERKLKKLGVKYESTKYNINS
jgi:hypothetical protein